MIKLSYENTLDEVIHGFAAFDKKYRLRRRVLTSAVYAVALFFAIQMTVSRYFSEGVILGGNLVFGILIIAVIIFMTVSMWRQPKATAAKIRKNWLLADESGESENYEAEFSEKKFEIISIIDPGGTYEDGKPRDKFRESQVIDYESHDVFEDETDKMFIIYADKRRFFVLPKRCLTQAQCDGLKDYFAGLN